MSLYNKIMMPGRTQGRVKILYETNKRIYRRTVWKCLCYCGNLFEATTLQLNRALQPQKSCSYCRDQEKYRPEYTAWVNMRDRCSNENHPAYHRYGGRGIFVCDRWNKDFLFFLEDMGFRPTAIHTLERVNNNLGYSKDNCVWLHQSLQASNRG